MQIHVRRNGAVDQVAEEGQQDQSHDEDRGSDPPVESPVEAQVGAEKFPVVVGHGLVHGGNDRGPEAQFGQREHPQDRPEKAVEAQIGGAHDPKKERSVQKGEEQLHEAVQGGGRHIPLQVFDKT